MTPTAEITFWKVFHNVYLFKKIFQIIKDTEWVHYKNYKQYHLENKIKFKQLKSLYWFIKRGQLEILKYKLKFKDEIIEIDEIGLRALIDYTVNCNDGDECISKFREIIIPLKENQILNQTHIIYLFDTSVNCIYGKPYINNNGNNFNSLQIVYEILSLFSNELNNEFKSFSVFQHMVEFIVIDDQSNQDSILLLFKIISNCFNNTQVFNDQQLSLIKEIVVQQSGGGISLKELEKSIIIISNDERLYYSYLKKYDQVIQEIKIVNNLLLEYSIESFSTNVLQHLINTNQIKIDNRSYEKPENDTQLNISYEKFNEFVKLFYSNVQLDKLELETVSKFKRNMIISILSFGKEQYDETISYLKNVDNQIKLPNCWNEIINKLTNSSNDNNNNTREIIINETSTIDWLIEYQDTFEEIYYISGYTIVWGTYQVEQYVRGLDKLFPEYIHHPLPFKTIEKAIRECSIDEFNNTDNLTKDDFLYNFEIKRDHFKLLVGQEIENKLSFLDYLFDKWYTQFDVMFFIADNLVELFPEWVIVNGKNSLDCSSNEFKILLKVIERLDKMGPGQITNCLSNSTAALNIEGVQFIFSNFVKCLQTNIVTHQKSHYSFTTNGDLQSLNYEYNTNTIINGIQYLIDNYNPLIHAATSSVINELYQRLVQVDGISVGQLVSVRNTITSTPHSIIINDDKIEYILEYLKIKSPKLIKYVMERGLKFKTDQYNSDGDHDGRVGNPFYCFRDVTHGYCMHNVIDNYQDNEYFDDEGIDGYEYLYADHVNIPLDLSILSFNFILGPNSNFDEILSILKSNLHPLHAQEKSINLDLIYYIEIRRMDLFSLEIENIKNNLMGGDTTFKFNENLLKLLQKLYNQEHINNLLN